MTRRITANTSRHGVVRLAFGHHRHRDRVKWLAVTAVLYLMCGVLDRLELARRSPPVAEPEPAGAWR